MYLLCLQKYTQIEARRPRLMKKQVAEEVLILQESRTRVVSAYQFTVRTTKVTGLCALWAHLDT